MLYYMILCIHKEGERNEKERKTNKVINRKR